LERLEEEDFGAPEDGFVAAETVARAIELLDAGQGARARAVLARALADAHAEPTLAPLDAASALVSLADGELERAFDDARPETESMIDADGIAFDAIRQARLDEPESVAPLPDSPFHTRTMADLLERQGDADAARAIRSTLAPPDPSGGAHGDTVRTLERWLGRLRGGEA
jgi:hypothetical protein